MFWSKKESTPSFPEEDFEEDEYIRRIKRGGCYDQHVKLQDCYWDTKDWRKCKKEMEIFRSCVEEASSWLSSVGCSEILTLFSLIAMIQYFKRTTYWLSLLCGFFCYFATGLCTLRIIYLDIYGFDQYGTYSAPSIETRLIKAHKIVSALLIASLLGVQLTARLLQALKVINGNVSGSF
ncbi:hypothetical protein HDU92_001190 [Lobulomyces angularis]|nr:hypothetical protein HDU92_001190 [Lobulomyces angularis]